MRIPGDCRPAQIATQRPLVPLPDRALGAPMPSARCRLQPAGSWLGPGLRFTGPAFGAETARALIGLFSIPGP